MLKELLGFFVTWLKEQRSHFEGGVPKARQWQILYLFSTILAPWGCLWIFANRQFGEAEWQDGKFSTYVDLTFSNEVWTLFAPFLFFSSVAMVLLLLKPQRFSQYMLVRLGIYSGAILAVHFSLQLALTSELFFVFVFGAVAIPILLIGSLTLFLFGLFLYLLWQHQPKSRRIFGLVGAVLALVVVLIALASPWFVVNSFFTLFVISLTSLLCALLTLCAPIALLTSGLLLTSQEIPKAKSLLFSLLGLGWIGGYAAAWYMAVNRVFDLYDQMPNQPNCYIATASANAYPYVLRSVPMQTKTGELIQISRQLQILKAGELILLATAPYLHAFVRRHYDVIGKRLAARISHPLLATVSYLLLKPLEWTTFFFIKLVCPQQIPTLSRFYTKT